MFAVQANDPSARKRASGKTRTTGVPHSFDQGPKAMLEQFEKLGDINVTFARYAAEAPAVKQAEATFPNAVRVIEHALMLLKDSTRR